MTYNPYQHRVPRADRRVMLVLLTGAPRLTAYPLARAAMVGSGKVYVILARLENLGWVEGEWEEPNPLPPGYGQRRYYRLTEEGVSRALSLLGLKDAVSL